MKNLDYALSLLARVSVPCRFDIFGPLEDAATWQRCLALIDTLPPHIEARHAGLLSQNEVFAAMARYDLLLLPTLGENFGHAILEALAAGTPVLISDRTPWRALQDKQAGWDLPLDEPGAFIDAIEEASRWSPERRDQMRAGARALAESVSGASQADRLAASLAEASGLRPLASSEMRDA